MDQNQNDSQEICAICLSGIEDKKKYTLECNHSFHIDCIVKWFRTSNGNCPCCWDNKKKKNFCYGVWERPYINTRCKKLEKYSKKVNDDKLQKKVFRLKEKVQEYDSFIQERKTLKKTEEYITLMKRINDLNKKINNKDRTIMNMKINLISDYPVIITN